VKKISSLVLGGSFLLCGLVLLSGCSYLPKDVMTDASMEPTLMNNTEVIIAKGDSVINNLERGDIILFKYPSDSESTLIRMVITLPGETIEIKDGEVYINDTLLSEPYVDSQIATLTFMGQLKNVMGDNEFFVMGDNRSDSADSRTWGSISEDTIIGKVVI